MLCARIVLEKMKFQFNKRKTKGALTEKLYYNCYQIAKVWSRTKKKLIGNLIMESYFRETKTSILLLLFSIYPWYNEQKGRENLFPNNKCYERGLFNTSLHESL